MSPVRGDRRNGGITDLTVGSIRAGALDPRRPPRPGARDRGLARHPRRRRLRRDAATGPARDIVRRPGNRVGARPRRCSTEHFDERPEGTFVVVFRGDPSDHALRRRLERRLEIAARQVPSGESRELRDGGGILYGEIATQSRAGRREAAHGVAARRTSQLRRAARVGDGPTGHSARPRSGARLGPATRRGSRRPARARRARLHVRRVVRGLHSVRVRGVHDRRNARSGRRRRTRPSDEHVRDESRRAHRLRACGRLLAPDRPPLPRGTCPERRLPGRDRAHDVDGGAGGRVLRARCGDRPRATALRARSVHPFDGRRRPARPARLDRGCADAPAGPPVARRAAPVASRCSAGRESAWATLSRWIMRRPLRVLLGGTALLLALAAPALALRVTPGSFEGIPHAPESSRGSSSSETGSAPGRSRRRTS